MINTTAPSLKSTGPTTSRIIVTAVREATPPSLRFTGGKERAAILASNSYKTTCGALHAGTRTTTNSNIATSPQASIAEDSLTGGTASIHHENMVRKTVQYTREHVNSFRLYKTQNNINQRKYKMGVHPASQSCVVLLIHKVTNGGETLGAQPQHLRV